MSRLAKKPIKLSPGATVRMESGFVVVNGPHGEKRFKVFPGVSVRVEGDNVWVELADGGVRRDRAQHGTAWSLTRNAIQGVTELFSKSLDIEGVGFRASLEGKDLVLSLGYAEPVRFRLPDGVTVTVEKNTITVTGVDKELVGRVAADIRSLKKPEPYKGKGIRYRGEVIRRKVGKKAGSTTGTP